MMRVLVVDDDPAILHMCAQVLRAQGHEVLTCDGGAVALQTALGRELDLALCDLNLPDMHGLDVIRAIKTQSPSLPIIVMSALDANVWQPLSTEAGAANFLQKPLRLELLRNEVMMAERARSVAPLIIALVDGDDEHRAQVARACVQEGALVRHHDVPMQAMSFEGPAPTILLVDGSLGGAEAAVRWAHVKGIVAVVMLPPKRQWAEEPFMRVGAALVLNKPIDPMVLLVHARFLLTST
jgi:DNA-binding response OmpR family regulator